MAGEGITKIEESLQTQMCALTQKSSSILPITHFKLKLHRIERVSFLKCISLGLHKSEFVRYYQMPRRLRHFKVEAAKKL